MFPALADGARWALLVVFAVSCAEKALSLLRGAAAWHPIVLVSVNRRRHAVLLMSASLLADVVPIFMLLAWPRLGAAIAGILVLCYSWVAFSLHSIAAPADCRCFLGLFNTHTKAGLVTRNTAPLQLACAVFVARADASWPGLVLAMSLGGMTLVLTALAEHAASISQHFAAGT